MKYKLPNAPEAGAYQMSATSSDDTMQIVNSFPQSDEVTMSDFDVGAVENKIQTQLFVEGDTVVVGSTASTHNVDTYIEQEDTIKDFLGRPKLLVTGSWTSALASDTNIWTQDIGSLLNSVTMWSEKVKGFRLFKGDFIVTIRVNATAFYQGQLILHYIPMYTHLASTQQKMYNSNLVQKFQHPHVDVTCRDTAVTLRIPYIAPSHYYDLKLQKWSWGTLFLDVVSQLRTGTAMLDGVDFAIYGHWENVTLIAPTVPQSDKGKLRETKENAGPIEAGLRNVEKVAEVAKNIPIVGAYASQVSWAANIGAKLASAFGMSKPRELSGNTTVANQTIKYHGTCDGPTVAVPGGVICNNTLEGLDFLSVTKSDEMTLAFLGKIPFKVETVNWTSATAVGTEIYSLLLKPTRCRLDGAQTLIGHTATYRTQHPLALLSDYFRFYRGSMKIRFRFVKTEMHTGRLEFTYTPGSGVTVPTISNSEYSMKTIVDIRGEDEIEIEFPYLLQSDYQLCDVEYGKVSVRVLDRLRAPETCSQTVEILSWVTFSEDFELAQPCIAPLTNFPFEPQSDEDVLHSRASKLMSDQAVGGQKLAHDDLLHAKRCMGERILSIKQLLLRASPISLTNNCPTTTSQFAMDPRSCMAIRQNAVTGLLNYGRLGADLLNVLGPMYMFNRGGVNIHVTNVTDRCATKLSSVYLGTSEIVDNASGNFGKIRTVTLGSVYADGNTAMFPTNNFDGPKADIIQHVPYYNEYMCSPFRLYDSVQAPELVDDYPSMNLLLGFDGGDLQYATLSRSVCDDFQLMFFICCPPILVNYV